MSSVIRRVVAGVCTVALLIIGVQFLGTTSAGAHSNTLVGVPACQANGTYTVTWTVTNDYTGTDVVTINDSAPAGAPVNPATVTLSSHGSGTMVQSAIPGNQTQAMLNLHGNWTDPNDPFQADTGPVTVALPGTCLPTHTPTVPTWTNGACVNNVTTQPTITIPSDNGVVYKVGNTVRSPGTYSVPAGTYTITATSTTLVLSGTTHWTFTLTQAPGNCGTVTTNPVTPRVTQTRCVNHVGTIPTLQLPSTTGIRYTVSAPAPYAAGQTVTVTAVAQKGYKFVATSLPNGWTFVDQKHATTAVTFQPALNCGSIATPTLPQATQTACPTGRTSPVPPTLTLPADSAEIHYVAEVIKNGSGSGTNKVGTTLQFQPGQTVRVTATAQNGFYFDTVPSGWTKVSDSVATLEVHFKQLGPNECTLSQRATKAKFTSQECQSGKPVQGTVTIAQTTGVKYTANGKKITAGTYSVPPNTTVTVVAIAKKGYELEGKTTWTHTFGSAPNCHKPSDVDNQHVNNHHPLASTGVQTENLITIGIGLMVLGALCTLLATRRRESKR